MTEPSKPVPAHSHPTSPEEDAAILVEENRLAAEKKAQKGREENQFKIGR